MYLMSIQLDHCRACNLDRNAAADDIDQKIFAVIRQNKGIHDLAKGPVVLRARLSCELEEDIDALRSGIDSNKILSVDWRWTNIRLWRRTSPESNRTSIMRSQREAIWKRKQVVCCGSCTGKSGSSPRAVNDNLLRAEQVVGCPRGLMKYVGSLTGFFTDL